MRVTRKFIARGAVAALLSLLAAACVVRTVQIESVPRVPTTIRSPVRAHLDDGSTALFRSGAEVRGDSIHGYGIVFDLTLRDSIPVQALPLSRIVGMEAYRPGVDYASTIILSTLGTAATLVGAAAAAVAIFGSCPTIYTLQAGQAVLEAESFSYSVAPLFELRDVDRLSIQGSEGQPLRLEIRNEALETHYINHLEIIEAVHRPGETVMPDPQGGALALESLTAPARAVDRSGRDVSGVLARQDSAAYRTHPSVLAAADSADLEDFIELAMPAPRTDSVALMLRLRNSLLTTVLFYDVMLGDRGAAAIDYQSDDLQRIGLAVDLGRWYVRYMGMRLSVWRDGGWRASGRFLDTGPIAWKELAVMLPVPAGEDTLRVRLSFVADNWRIDRAAFALSTRRPVSRTVPIARVIDAEGRLDSAALMNLAAADTRYLQTTAGQRFFAEFDAGPLGPGAGRTFLLAAQGWYSEWIRSSWIVGAPVSTPFEPGAPAVAEALRRWKIVQRDFERRFTATRIPVR